MHCHVASAIADPSGQNLVRGEPPEGWGDLLAWSDRQRDTMLERLAAGPDAPAWLPFPAYEQTVGSWARRQAHEAAIHRLDAEHAADQGTVTFEAAFAADGVDELVVTLTPNLRGREVTEGGSVLVHAADAERVWVIQLSTGRPPHAEPISAIPAAVQTDVTIAGTADSVYRAMWNRPNTAKIVGDTALLEPIAAP